MASVDKSLQCCCRFRWRVLRDVPQMQGPQRERNGGAVWVGLWLSGTNLDVSSFRSLARFCFQPPAVRVCDTSFVTATLVMTNLDIIPHYRVENSNMMPRLWLLCSRTKCAAGPNRQMFNILYSIFISSGVAHWHVLWTAMFYRSYPCRWFGTPEWQVKRKVGAC